MTRAAVALGLILAVAVPAGAYEIRDYQLTIRTDAGGDGDAALHVLLSDAGGTARIPVGFRTITDARIVTGPAGASVAVEPAGSQCLLVVTWPGAGHGEAALDLTFRVASVVPPPVVPPGERPTLPKGNRLLKHSFINTQSEIINRYSVQVGIPGGLRVHAVREALPKLRSGEAGPRLRLEPSGATAMVTLVVAEMRQGDAASVQVELAPQRRSPWWIVAGVLLSAFYLFKFRDLVSKPAA